MPDLSACVGATSDKKVTATPAVTSGWVMEKLAPEYGPVDRTPRYDPMSELVFTILSQHTSDVNAEKAFRNLMATFGALEKVAEANPEEIARAVQTAGLFRVKSVRIKAVLRRIRELRGELSLDFLRDMPMEDAKAWLRQLPGVGPKSAAIVLCFALGMPAMPVDTHVHRVARRLGLIGPKTTAEQAHELLEGMVPPEQVFAFHVYLITHGRRVCKAPKPLCQRCVLEPRCPSSILRSRP